MATQDINKLRQLFEGSKIGENRVQPPVFGARTSPEGDINAQQSYEDLFPPGDIQNVRMQNVLNPDSIDYKPETRDMDRYREYIDQYPEQKESSGWDRIIAGGMTLGNRRRGIQGGYEVGKKYLDAPYEREVEEWKSKVTPLGVAATQENARNVNARQMAGYELRDKQYQEGIASRERIAAEKNATTQRKNEILDSKNRGYTYSVVGNKLIGHAPDGRTFEAGEASDYSPLELERLRQTGRVELEGTRQTGRMELEGERTRGDIAVRQTVDPNRTSTEDEVEDPVKTRTRRNNAMRELYDDPRYRDFIQPGEASTDDWTFTEPPSQGGWWGNASDEEVKNYTDMRRELDRKVQATTPPKRTTRTTTTTGPTLPKGTEVGRPPDGGTFKFNAPPQTNAQEPMYSQGKNQRTGEVGQIVSYDGGKTWQPVNK